MTSRAAPSFIPQIRLYQNWLRQTRGLSFDSYEALWRWSVTELDAFWQSVWDYFELQSPTPHAAALAGNTMPGARWFPGAQVNYAQQVLRHVGGATSRAAPTLPGPSSAATANCRWFPARCSAACWAARWKPGTSRASR